MNDNTRRNLLLLGIVLNGVMLILTLLDFAWWNGSYYGYLFVAWVFLIVLVVILALSGLRLAQVTVVQPAPARVVSKAEPSDIPFVFNGYTLYGRDVELKNGGKRPIYFFSKRKPASGHMIAKPAGFHVGVNERTGLPFLKRGTGKDGEDLTPAAPEPGYRPQCSAITADGAQCRNSSRDGSKYCGSHFGYQPSTAATVREETGGRVRDTDTKPRVRRARDTTPAIRKASS